MSRFEAALEISQCLHKRPRCLARSDINRMPCVEIPDKAGKQTFNGAHCLERKVDDIVADAVREAAHLIPQECGEVDVRENEFNVFNLPVKARAERSEQAHSAFGLIPRECKKSAEEGECHEDEKEVRH